MMLRDEISDFSDIANQEDEIIAKERAEDEANEATKVAFRGVDLTEEDYEEIQSKIYDEIYDEVYAEEFSKAFKEEFLRMIEKAKKEEQEESA